MNSQDKDAQQDDIYVWPAFRALVEGPEYNSEESRSLALLGAASGSFTDIARRLLETGAKTAFPDEDGNRALHLSAKNQHIGMIKLLLEERYKQSGNFDINARNNSGETPLHLATEAGQSLSVQLLLEHDADVDAITSNGERAFHIAASLGNAAVVKLLLDVGAEHCVRNSQGKQPLHLAVERGDVDVVEMLLSKGADIDARDNQNVSPLLLIVNRKDTKMLEMVLESHPGVDIGSKQLPTERTVLQECCFNPEATKLLLERGANAMTRSNSNVVHAVFQAATGDGAETIRLYLDAGFQPDCTGDDGGSILNVAAFHGQLATVQLLVERGADVNAADKKGTAPIHRAAMRDTPEMVKYLLHQGADLEEMSDEYGTPLMAAVWEDRTETVKFLLGQEANVNATSPKSCPYYTALQAAVKRNSPTMVGILLEHGADVNLQDHRGQTVLIYAIRRGHHETVQRLLEARGDPLSRDVRGRDALYWAALRGDADMFGTVFRQVDKLARTKSPFVLAINAAAAAGQADFVKELLAKVMTDFASTLALADSNGWTALYTAEQCDNPEIVDTIRRAMLGVTGGSQGAPPLLQAPTEWHPRDKFFSLLRQPDARSISLSSIARANHPMVPTRDDVYYFEVTIVNEGLNSSPCKRLAVGFCREDTPLGSSADSSWGGWWYHGGNGHFGNQEDYVNPNCGPKYGKGDVIGCGVNFKHRTAFYTKNGEIIEYMASGLAFQNVQGRLYPAVMVHADMAGFELKAQFCEEGGDESAGFRFKGSYTDEKTFFKCQQDPDFKDSDGLSDACGILAAI
ncbi:Ankyrin repeat-containing domain protein, partial [Metarhizium hybridum]